MELTKRFPSKLLLFALLSSCAYGQLPDAPKPSPLELADIQLRMVDATSTYQFQHHPCRCFHEGDPLMPDDGRAGVIALSQAGYTIAILGGSRWLEHRGHHRLSRILLWSDIASESLLLEDG